MAFQKIRRLRFVEVVLRPTTRQLADADADARTRREQYQKLLLSPARNAITAGGSSDHRRVGRRQRQKTQGAAGRP